MARLKPCPFKSWLQNRSLRRLQQSSKSTLDRRGVRPPPGQVAPSAHPRKSFHTRRGQECPRHTKRDYILPRLRRAGGGFLPADFFSEAVLALFSAFSS